uniref:Uncharacterized protein n=1 Tax=Solanum tuberosum TaxID=4113 RepID=M1DT57_SOLTU
MDVAGKKGYGKKRNAANKNQEVPLEVKPNERITSQEPSTTEAIEDDVKVLLEDVTLSKEWITKVNVGMDAVEISGQCLGKVECTLGILKGILLKRWKTSEAT